MLTKLNTGGISDPGFLRGKCWERRMNLKVPSKNYGDSTEWAEIAFRMKLKKKKSHSDRNLEKGKKKKEGKSKGQCYLYQRIPLFFYYWILVTGERVKEYQWGEIWWYHVESFLWKDFCKETGYFHGHKEADSTVCVWFCPGVCW